MKNQDLINNDTVNALLRFARVSTILCITISLSTIIVRIIHFPWLYKISPGIILMNPLTAILLILTCIALWLVRDENKISPLFNVSYKTISKIICILVIAISFFRIVFDFFDWPFILDLLLFRKQLEVPQQANLTASYNVMSLKSAISLFLLGLSIIFIDSNKNWIHKNPQTLNYIVIFISILTIYGYIYKVEDLYLTLGRAPMSSLTAACFLLLSISVLFFRPYQGTMAHIIGQNPTQVFTMRVLAFIIPLIIGFLKIQGEKNNIFTENFGTAIIATTTYIISMTLLGWKTSIQYKLQKAKKAQFAIIKKQRKKMRRILDTSPSRVQILDLTKMKNIYANEVKEEVQILPKNEIVEKNYEEILEEFVHPEDLKKEKERLSQFQKLDDNEFDDQIFRIKNKEGSTSWIFNRAIVFKRVDGKPTQILLNTINITKQKEKELELNNTKKELEEKKKELEEARKNLKDANNKLKKKVEEREEALVKSEKKYHSYIRNSFNGIIQYEHHGSDIDLELPTDDFIKQVKEKSYIKEVNQVAADILGYNDPEELKGISFLEHTKDIPEKELHNNIKNFIKSDYRLFGLEPVVIKKGGQKIQTYINLLGIVKNKKLVKVWEIQSKSKIKKID